MDEIKQDQWSVNDYREFIGQEIEKAVKECLSTSTVPGHIELPESSYYKTAWIDGIDMENGTATLHIIPNDIVEEISISHIMEGGDDLDHPVVNSNDG